jgi:hypothetical protein
MAIYKRGKVYGYEFAFNGERCRGSAETGDQKTARQREAHERLKLAKGEAGISDPNDIPTLKAFSVEFMRQIRMERATPMDSGNSLVATSVATPIDAGGFS